MAGEANKKAGNSGGKWHLAGGILLILVSVAIAEIVGTYGIYSRGAFYAMPFVGILYGAYYAGKGLFSLLRGAPPESGIEGKPASSEPPVAASGSDQEPDRESLLRARILSAFADGRPESELVLDFVREGFFPTAWEAREFIRQTVSQ